VEDHIVVQLRRNHAAHNAHIAALLLLSTVAALDLVELVPYGFLDRFDRRMIFSSIVPPDVSLLFFFPLSGNSAIISALLRLLLVLLVLLLPGPGGVLFGLARHPKRL
jgi:hypothetical protein